MERAKELDVFAKRVKHACYEASITEESEVVGYFINGL